MKDFTISCSLLRPISVVHAFVDFDLAQDYVVVIRMLQEDVAVELDEGFQGFVADFYWEAWRHVARLVALTRFVFLRDQVFLHVKLYFLL